MSILRVANLQFNASGTRRIDYDAVGDDGIIKISAAAVKLPVGDTASRPTSQAGMIRYNSQLDLFEGANSTSWGSIGGTVDFATANGWANTVGTAGNNYTNAVGTAGNNYTNYVGASANSYATTMDTAGNNYTNSVGLAGNNYTNAVGLAGNNYVNSVVFPAANTALQNTSGISFNGNFYVPSGKVGIGNTSPVGQLTITAANTVGGVGYADFLRVTNNSYPAVTNPVKTFRLNQTGGIEIINNAYTAVIASLDDSGNFAVGSRGITKGSMPAGSILQVQSTTLTSTFTTSSTSWADLIGMSVSITPTSATSKILVQISLNFQGDSSTQGYCRIDRNGTVIGVGDANGSRYRFTINQYVNQQNEARTISMTYLDSPATTSALTYKLQLTNQGLGTVYVNRSTAWADNATSGTGISTITVYEIAQ